jgi:hypothetical protein
MAWTANSFLRRLKAASSFGYYGSPMTLHGYLNVTTVVREGDVLINTVGTLTRAASDPPEGTIIGILGSIAPTSGTQRPKTSGTLPAASLPRQRTPTATVPDRTKYDDDKSVAFWPWITGNIFEGHFVTNATDDETADSDTDIYVNSTCYLATNDWAFGLSGAITGMTLGFINPQATTVAASVLVNTPGPVFDDTSGTTGTKNPLVLVVPKSGKFISAL